MIVHVIERDKKKSGKVPKSSYKRLAHYIVAAKSDQDQILWHRTAEYILGSRETSDGEKVLWTRLTNCDAEIPLMAIAEIEATQAQNTRSKADKTYHMVVSFRENEKPTREQIDAIEDAICEGLGFVGHQRISAVHQDTDNLHLHIAVNKVHPQRLTVHEPYYPYLKIDSLCKQLEREHGLEQDNRIGEGQNKGRAGDMEAHTNEESLLTWIKAEAGTALKNVAINGQNWLDVHAMLAEYDLQIKPYGAGLVIGTMDGRLHVKASSVDRSLSFKKMTERFGEYVPPKALAPAKAIEEQRQYRRGPRQKIPGGESLYSRYQKEKEAMYTQKKLALAAIQESQVGAMDSIKSWYAERRTAVKLDKQLSNSAKRTFYQTLSAEMKADYEKQKKKLAAQRSTVQAELKSLSWDDWLVREAEQGDTQALGILRKRSQNRKRIAQALLTISDLETAETVVRANAKPKTLKNGDVLYRVNDGGLVTDGADGVHVTTVTEASTILALSLADERFKDKPLKVDGTDEFKLQIVKAAAMDGCAVTFADSVMESNRQMYVRARKLSRENIDQHKINDGRTRQSEFTNEGQERGKGFER